MLTTKQKRVSVKRRVILRQKEKEKEREREAGDVTEAPRWYFDKHVSSIITFIPRVYHEAPRDQSVGKL